MSKYSPFQQNKHSLISLTVNTLKLPIKSRQQLIIYLQKLAPRWSYQSEEK